MITHPWTSFTRLLPAVLLMMSGCQLESFSERQTRQRQQYLGEAASSQQLAAGNGIREIQAPPLGAGGGITTCNLPSCIAF